MLPLDSNYKCATIASPTPRNTPQDRPSHLSFLAHSGHAALSPSRSTENLPTPGLAENPLSFHMRLHEKSNSLQNAQRAANGNARRDDPTYAAPDDLERFLYGNAAMNLEVSHSSAFTSSNDVPNSAGITDWEEMKKQLKEDQLRITRRVSRRKSEKEPDSTAAHVGNLDPAEHFYFKPNASRKEAEESLHACPEGTHKSINGRLK